MHLCHRTFLFNNKNYLDKVFDEGKYDAWDVSKLNRGIVKNMGKYLVVNKDSTERNKARYLYTIRGYHDSVMLKISTTSQMINSLAKIGQINKIYGESEELCHMLAVFLNTKMSCPVEAYLNTGSLHLNPISLVRIWGNGAFERILSDVLGGYNEE